MGKPSLNEILNIQFPIIMAPMFLVSNQAMVSEGIKAGVMATFPTLNYRKQGELEQVLDAVSAVEGDGSYGVNLIVQLSNPLYKKHLEVCVAKKVPFYITSLGNPKEVIEKAHAYGAKVFCDVTNIEHAKKVMDLGADGFIAVGAGAGGHAGPIALHVLVENLVEIFPNMPVVAAGGISTGKALKSMMVLGAVGASIGTRFIATTEAEVSDEYKNAIVDYGMNDIVLTEKISGTPCAVINTPYAKKIGTKQSFWEKLLSKNRTVRKYFKMLVQIRGMKKLESAVKPGTYKTLWSAGQSVGMIKNILSVEQIVENLKSEYQNS
jgi:nitronate monooxygenase